MVVFVLDMKSSPEHVHVAYNSARSIGASGSAYFRRSSKKTSHNSLHPVMTAVQSKLLVVLQSCACHPSFCNNSGSRCDADQSVSLVDVCNLDVLYGTR